MKTLRMLCIANLMLLMISTTGYAQNETIKLPQPIKNGGMPLMEALQARKSSRTFSTKEVDMQTLSNLLWAGFGITRNEKNLRTAPSARNYQEFDIYVVLKSGVYVYNALENSLVTVLSKDIREAAGKQDFVKDAPINLVYVANFDRMGDLTDEVKNWYSAADVGFISQNIYLFCASEGLGTVVRGMVDKESLKEKLMLSPNQHVVLGQTIGYTGE